MQAKKGWIVVLTCMLVVSLVGAGCSKPAQTQKDAGADSKAAASKPTELVVAQAANPTTMDPHDAQDTLSHSIMKSMYEGLLGFDKDMKVVPVLAESLPELGSDAKSATFKLRKGVKFHDGEEFNAEAVKANLDRIKNPDNKLKRASLFQVVEKVEVIDPYTVKFVLNQPFAAITQTFAHPASMMISPKSIKENNKEVQRKPVGTGPYQFVEWKDADHVTIKKFDGYWDKANAAKVDKIVFKPVTEASSRTSMLKTGEVQFVYPLSADQVDSVKNDNNIVVNKAPSILEFYVVFNMTKKPFDNKKVRQALNYAIDKNTLIKVVYKGFGTPAESIIAPNVWGFQKQQMYDYNREKAKSLLSEAGFPNGFETTLWVVNASETVKAAEFIQQQWKEVGVKVNIQQMEKGTLLNQLYVKPEESKMQTYMGSWSPSTGEADWGIRPLLTKAQFPPAGYNTGFYVNEEAEKLIEDGLRLTTDKERLEAYANVQKLVVEEAPWGFLYVTDIISGKRSNLNNAFVLPDGSLDLKRVEFK
ncbi:glutathione ABC transporter substrate-binding protein [Paenibacillus sp. EPM92]|uniref:glutathione ABC transporter substrate-binding protein n=1 Tax=Paenibacillus sp. EPM92 TaxID=1561195 RepID=UPI001915F189|nr:glutathione ABC transporter substrate-binding protein [Paenibacillus sp. EPM92]